MALYLAIRGTLVPKQYSIAEARDHPANIVHEMAYQSATLPSVS